MLILLIIHVLSQVSRGKYGFIQQMAEARCNDLFMHNNKESRSLMKMSSGGVVLF